MTHWTDELERAAGDDEPLVRPYTITGGRTAPEHGGLTLITVVTSAADDDPDDPGLLQPEHRAIIACCAEPIAVAEIAAGLDLPVSVTKILVADLAEQGRVTLRAPLAVASGNTIDMTLLQEVRNGLADL